MKTDNKDKAPHLMVRFKIWQGDITTLATDAIVNAANETLLGGGGVDGAIHAAAGAELLAACRSLPELSPGVRCPTGEARITAGFKLAAKYVIHTVGPVYTQHQADAARHLLSSCYLNAMNLLEQHALQSIAFPAISCGVYGYPPAQAAEVAYQTLGSWAKKTPATCDIILVAFQPSMRNVLKQHFASVLVE